MNRIFRALIAFVATIAVATPVMSAGLVNSAGASAVTYTATQSFTPPSSNFGGATGGGDGWAIAIYNGRVYNVFHHSNYFGLMCHLESNAAPCWTLADTGGTNVYKTITATVGTSTATFATPGKVGLYVDQTTGLLYVYAARNDSGYSQPGVVCVNLNAADTTVDPVCSGTGGQPPAWTGLTQGMNDSYLSVSSSGGTATPTFFGGKLYAFNPYPGAIASTGGTASSGKNALLCYDIALQSPCAGEPYALNFGSSTATNSDGNPPAPDTLVSGHYFIPTSWSTGAQLACVDLTTPSPQNCVGTWPLAVSASFVIPSLDTTGTVNGICAEESSWSCYGLDGTAQSTPSGLTTSSLQVGSGGYGGAGWAGAPIVVGTRVLEVNPGGNSVYCYDFATNAACTTSSGHFLMTLAGLSLIYTVNLDPQNPTCVWVNSNGGSSQIQNFDALTGGTCASAPVRVYASSFV